MILIMIPIMILVCNLRLKTVYICIVSNIMHHIESFVSFLVLLAFCVIEYFFLDFCY